MDGLGALNQMDLYIERGEFREATFYWQIGNGTLSIRRPSIAVARWRLVRVTDNTRMEFVDILLKRSHRGGSETEAGKNPTRRFLLDAKK